MVKKTKPIPQAIVPGEYTIHSGPKGYGMTCAPRNGENGEFKTPMDSSAESAAIRAHEYGHLQLYNGSICDPDKLRKACEKAGIDPGLYQIGMDALVNGRYRSLVEDLPIESSTENLDKISKNMREAVIHLARASTLPNPRAGNGTLVINYMTNKGEEIFGNTEYAETCFNAIRDIVAISRTERVKPASFVNNLARVQSILDDIIKREEEEYEEPKEPQNKGLTTLKEFKGGDFLKIAGRQWGEMTIVEPPRFRDAAKILGIRRWKRSFVGALKAPYRRFTDLKMFSIKKAVSPRTVLLDASGSMSITNDDILRMLHGHLSTQVACYSGDGRGRGNLVIIAKDGMIADIHEVRKYIHSANEIDGPALVWLGQQRGDRDWICDGGVTGVGDCCSDALNSSAMAIAISSRLKQYENVDSYLIRKEMRVISGTKY